MTTLYGILLPFIGTALGAACVFLMKKTLGNRMKTGLIGFAGGVMVAASVWSLIIPAMEQAKDMGKLSVVPVITGLWAGIIFLLILDYNIAKLYQYSTHTKVAKSDFKRTTMMVMAVILHNIPEGMAIGAVYAGFLSGNSQITAAGAIALSIGIAIQNFPEGAIISMPLYAERMKKWPAFLCGVLSGIVEPVGAILTILAAELVVVALPYFLSFAAGAMIYVVVKELTPEMSAGKYSEIGIISFAVGFSFMMLLDVTLG